MHRLHTEPMALALTMACSFWIGIKMCLFEVHSHRSQLKRPSGTHRRGSWWLGGLLAMLISGAIATAQELDSPPPAAAENTVLSGPLIVPVGIKLDPGQGAAASAHQRVVLIPGLLAGAESLQSSVANCKLVTSSLRRFITPVLKELPQRLTCLVAS